MNVFLYFLLIKLSFNFFIISLERPASPNHLVLQVSKQPGQEAGIPGIGCHTNLRFTWSETKIKAQKRKQYIFSPRIVWKISENKYTEAKKKKLNKAKIVAKVYIASKRNFACILLQSEKCVKPFKGTVQQDFLPPVFFIIRICLCHWPTG